jgi:hypothetical protein
MKIQELRPWSFICKANTILFILKILFAHASGVLPLLSINSELQEDLRQVKTQFKAEISQKAGYLGQVSGNNAFVHSRLVLIAAKLGNYDFSRLKPAAVAVELLDLALREHFKQEQNSSESDAVNGEERPDQFWLIRGDHLFARALSLVASLGDARIVRVLSQVIADVSESQLLDGQSRTVSVKERVRRFRKMVSLYVASAQVGAIIGGLNLATANTLRGFSLNLGLHHQAGSYQAEKYKMAAKDILHRLPESPYRSLLEDLLGIQSRQLKEV